MRDANNGLLSPNILQPLIDLDTALLALNSLVVLGFLF